MSQNDFSIANADGATVRSDINSALQALATLSSGTSAPPTTYAGQLWWDTGNNLIKQRNGANNGWVTVASFDGVVYRAAAAGAALARPLAVAGVLAPHAGLVLDANTTPVGGSALAMNEVRLQVDEAIVTDSAGSQRRLAGIDVSETSWTTSAWRHLWLADDGASPILRFDVSADFGSLWLPGGYTHAGYMGACYFRSVGGIRPMSQVGDRAAIAPESVLTNGSQSGWTAVDLSTVVPATARSVGLVARASSNAGNDAVMEFASTSAAFGHSLGGNFNTGGIARGWVDIALIEAQTVYYKASDSGGTDGDVIGWRF